MDNSNTNYKDAIKGFYVKQGVTKDKVPYEYLSLVFANDYEHRIFLRGAEWFAVKNALSVVELQKAFNSDPDNRKK